MEITEKELAKLRKSQKYLDSLAKGIDPFTGETLDGDSILSNTKIQNCLKYVTSVLSEAESNTDKRLKRSAIKKREQANRGSTPFYITKKQLKNIEISEEDCFVRNIIDMLNQATESNSCKMITSTPIIKWLAGNNYFKDVEIDGSVRKIVSSKGEKVGMKTQMRARTKGDYPVTLYDKRAQKFIYDNLDEIIPGCVRIGINIDPDLNRYFDTVLKDIDPQIVLDKEQREAIIANDDHCLLVAGAGAGKTTTMAAKVKYLVDKLGVSPEEIMVISYTNKAIGELKEKINGSLKLPVPISTFHKFAFDIIKGQKEKPPEVNYTAYNIIFDSLENNLFKDKNFMRNIVLFFGYYFDLSEDILEFDDLSQYHMYKTSQELETMKSTLGEYVEKQQKKRLTQNKTIKGEYLRSAQEVQIANFLYLNNLEYEYEPVYGQMLPGSNKNYTPDFLITQGVKNTYLEHYGVSQTGENPLFTKKSINRYKKSIMDKRSLHKKKGTDLIETWSKYKDGRPLLEHLKETLEKSGFSLKERDLTEVYEKILETGKDKYLLKLVKFMIRFIELYKGAGYDVTEFTKLKRKTKSPRTKLFLDIAKPVYNHYQKTLIENNQIDFADMINDANKYLDEIEHSDIRLDYKYIIIDEFQDIARQRFNFAKRLSQVTGAHVTAVGDDWQSIFAFAGSDITLFTRFTELMGSGNEMRITNTYRNSQELIDIAGSFIQKNSTQIKKHLKSPKRIKDPVVIREYDDSYKPLVSQSEAVENIIGEIIEKYGEKSSILLLGRYNFDMYNLMRTRKFEEGRGNRIICRKYPTSKIEFMTAHSAKGLGYDNVILINMTEGRFGFPCQIEDDPIIKMVSITDYSIPFAEERRLFYVALTRTKNKVYIATPLNKPSRFIREIIKDHDIPFSGSLNMNEIPAFDLKCPDCGFPLKLQYKKDVGLMLYMCTNDSEVCEFMTNNKNHLYNIFKCDCCNDGFMVVRVKDGSPFYGCTNYNADDVKCRNTYPIYPTHSKIKSKTI